MPDIQHLHHVGLVVHDMSEALATYRRLGFELPSPAVPMLPDESGAMVPFGAANTHAYFRRNFVELVSILTASSAVPTDATLAPLQVPEEALPSVRQMIESVVARFGARLARHEGLHRLVFSTGDADLVAARLSKTDVDNSGVNVTQRPVERDGEQLVETVRHLEITAGPNGEGAPEAILAVAELESEHASRPTVHPNGANDLVEAVLCVAADEIGAVEARYETYLERTAVAAGPARVFELDGSMLTLLPDGRLEDYLPGEEPPALPALVAYGVTVDHVRDTARDLVDRGVEVRQGANGIFVPARSACGGAVVFRERLG